MYNNRWWPVPQEERDWQIKEFGKNLALLRAMAHISQTGLCNIVGISRQTISKVERGDVELTWHNYLTLAYFFSTCEDTAKAMRGITPGILAYKDGK